MKITVTVNADSKVATLDLYPSENVLYIKTNGCCVRKEISTKHAETLMEALTKNPIGTLIELTEPVERVPFIEKISSNKAIGNFASTIKHR